MIEFVIPTYNSPDKLMVILQSLIVQTDDRWIAHVVIDGMTNEYRYVKDIYQNNPKIRFSHIEGPNKDWGHTARNYGLSKAQEEWMVMTGDDNYYVPTFVSEMLNQSDGKHFVYCDMVHNHFGYMAVRSDIKLGQIDIGNMMFKPKLAEGIELDKTDYNADWTFINRYRTKHWFESDGFYKVNKVLYVHN